MVGMGVTKWLLWGVAAMLLALLVYAWVDGGREPLQDMAEPVALPGAFR